MPKVTPVKVLREAKALVKSGWTQGAYESMNKNRHKNYCALGAIEKALELNRIKYDERHAMWEIVVGVFVSAIRQPSITSWNDSARRTKPQVVAVFDKAIAKAAKIKGDKS